MTASSHRAVAADARSSADPISAGSIAWSDPCRTAWTRGCVPEQDEHPEDASSRHPAAPAAPARRAEGLARGAAPPAPGALRRVRCRGDLGRVDVHAGRVPRVRGAVRVPARQARQPTHGRATPVRAAARPGRDAVVTGDDRDRRPRSSAWCGRRAPIVLHAPQRADVRREHRPARTRPRPRIGHCTTPDRKRRGRAPRRRPPRARRDRSRPRTAPGPTRRASARVRGRMAAHPVGGSRCAACAWCSSSACSPSASRSSRS